MKKIVLLFLFVGAFLLANAQPVLTSNEMLPFGTLATYEYAAYYNVIDTTTQGANVSWNFSSLLPSITKTGYSIEIVDPATTPYTASFPTADYAYKEITPSVSYRYFTLSTDKFERIGSYVSSVKTYSDPQIEMTFPFQLGTTNYDTWVNNISDGDYQFTCLGYGILTLPSGTYNAFLARAVATEDNMMFGLITIPLYLWYSSDNGQILVQFQIGDGFLFSTVASYMTSTTIDVSETKIVESVKYNNPVDNDLKISFTANDVSAIQYQIMNMSGSIVKAGNIAVSASTSNQVEINMSSLCAGMYFVSLNAANSNFKPEILKVIKK